jgi:uncharacterized protein YjbI with pentapeptide repeats
VDGARVVSEGISAVAEGFEGGREEAGSKGRGLDLVTDQRYNWANIRKLLTEGFNDQELRALCFDVPYFRPVYDQLAQNTGKAEIVAKLLEHAEKQMLVDILLALARDRNPARYAEHEPYYLSDSAQALQALQGQVSELAKRLATLTSPKMLTKEQQFQIAYHWVELGRKDSLREFDLSQTDLRAINLVEADLRLANLSEAKLNLANLARADLRIVNFKGACLSEADLRGANLSRANLSRADLSQADLYGANLTRTNLSQANLYKANLYKARLYGADLRWANLLGVTIRDEDAPVQLSRKWNWVWRILNKVKEGQYLCGADLSQAYLSQAYLSKADLSGANLCQANLSQANLSGANLCQANLSQANLSGANLSEAKYDQNTQWPPDFDPKAAQAMSAESLQ